MSLVAGETFWVRPDGNNQLSGATNRSAWASIDRGQPASVRVAVLAGSMQLPIDRGSQFPAKGAAIVGANTQQISVTYTKRTDTALFLSYPLPRALKVGELVASTSWTGPGAGDTIAVGEGVFTLGWVDTSTAQAGAVYAVACFRAGGSAATGPLTLRGHGATSVLDGRFIGNALALHSSYVHVESLRLRRGSLVIFRAAHILVVGIDIHMVHSYGAMEVGYSSTITVTNSTIRDTTYNHQAACVSVQRGTTNFTLTHSNVVACDTGIRIGGLDPDYGRYDRPDIVIKNNLVVGCHANSFAADHGVRLSPHAIDGNLLLVAGRQTHLNATGGANYYSPSLVDLNNRSFTPNNLHVDPQVVSWDDSSPHFLAVTPNSACVKAGSSERSIGAGPVVKFPSPKYGNSLLVNGGFSAGLYGWTVQGDFDFTYVANSSWVLQEYDQDICLQMCTAPVHTSDGTLRMVPIVARTMSTVVGRGQNLTISFAARAWTNSSGNTPASLRSTIAKLHSPSTRVLEACLYVPSWQDRSVVCSSELAVQIDRPEWQTFSVSLGLPYWWPSTTAVEFRTVVSSVSTCVEIDNVTLTQVPPGEPAPLSKNTLAVTLVPDLQKHLGLYQPGSAVEIFVSSESTHVGVEWVLRDPASRLIAQGTINHAGRNSIPLAASATGALLLSFKSDTGDFIAPIRIMVGDPATRVEDHLETFSYSATPSWPDLQLIVGSSQLQTQLQQLAALGLNTLHYYGGTERMNAMMSEAWVSALMKASKAAGVSWLMTLDDRNLFVPGWPTPVPGNVSTDAQLAIWSATVSPFAQQFCEYVSRFEVLNEPNANGYTAPDYLRVLDNTSNVLRATCPSARILGGCLVCGGGTMGGTGCDCCAIWTATIGAADQYDELSFHPYRFNNPDPETDGAGQEKPAPNTPWTFRRMMQQARNQLPKSKGVYLTEEGQGPNFAATRMLPMELS